MKVNSIFVHCSATKPNKDIGVKEIREWHLKKGWSDVGYHYVIRRDGTIEEGRKENVVGAHVYGYNGDSLGICLVGGVDERGKADANFTYAQYTSLVDLVENLKAKHGLNVKIRGHRDVAAKACPSFDVHTLFEYT